MSDPNEPDPAFQDELWKRWASQSIEMQCWQWPEFRLELMDGQLRVGGMLAGSHWLLQAALTGWGLESAIAFAPLEQWWEALRLAYGVSCQTSEEWQRWAESLPLASASRSADSLLLGSQYTGEHRWVRDHLRQSLMVTLGCSHLGCCFGPNYGLQLGKDVLTPDILMLTAEQLATNRFHDCYTELPAHLVVEVSLPERRGLDEGDRFCLYEQAQIPHYWIVDPVGQRFSFWQWTPGGYQPVHLDSDGCYRGVDCLSFSPDIFWLTLDQNVSPYTQKLLAFTSLQQPRQWHLCREPGSELGYGSMPFAPTISLEPQPISVEQFMSWCPETKLEGPPFPLIGGETGTRNAIALMLMSLGLVETVKLVAGYEWVRVLQRITHEQQADAGRRERWWQHAKTIAHQLKQDHGVGGVGALIDDVPLNTWSRIQLVLWNVPEQFQKWQVVQTLPQSPPVELIEAVWALPGEWLTISQEMQVLSR
ncbi:MAG: Uma2 family endonuclease [Leptolyngbya sp. RL_3_1]|nr:Uma2 family endonuclease [Leptolyngbya sp. RL_3_1]